MKALADYVHAKGLKFGVYSDAGSKTCEGRPASRGYEVEDARQYAAWGVDYLKYDWCNTDGVDPKIAYPTMRDAFKATRPADRVQHVRMGTQPAVDLGPRSRAPLADDRRHPGQLGAALSACSTSRWASRNTRGPAAGTIPTCWKWATAA